MNIKAAAFYTGLTGATLLGGCAKKAEPLAKIVEKAQTELINKNTLSAADSVVSKAVYKARLAEIELEAAKAKLEDARFAVSYKLDSIKSANKPLKTAENTELLEFGKIYRGFSKIENGLIKTEKNMLDLEFSLNNLPK